MFLQLLPLMILVPVELFWAWMFWDMVNNDNVSNQAAPVSWPPTSKYNWMLAFIFLNIVAAGTYYFTEYKERR